MAAQRNFPHDVIQELLVWVPFKSLMRFKSVSKQWFLLFSDSKFTEANKARARAPNKSHKYFLHSYKNCEPYTGIIHNDIDSSKGGILRAITLKLSPLEPNYLAPIATAAKCGGLLCMLSLGNVVVWNPSTNEHNKFPLPQPVRCRYYTYCIGLGLGYAASNDDYKVVVVTSSLTSSDSDLHVLSLKTGAWKTLENRKHYNSLTASDDRVGTAFNGGLYWNAYGSIICFDLETERDHVVVDRNHRILDGGRPKRGHRRCVLKALEWSLYVASYDYEFCDVWVWRKGEDWTKVLSSWHPGLYSERAICLIGNDKILVRKDGGKTLSLCNLSDNSIEEIAVQGQDGRWCENFQCVVPYEASLVRPGGNVCV